MNENYNYCHHGKTTLTFIWKKSKKIAKRFYIQKAKKIAKRFYIQKSGHFLKS